MHIQPNFSILNPNRFQNQPNAYQISTTLDDMDTDYYLDSDNAITEELDFSHKGNIEDPFRTHELYDEEIDINQEDDITYDEDDIIPERSYAMAYIDGVVTQLNPTINTDLKEIKLLKNGHKVPEERVLASLVGIKNKTIDKMFDNEEDLKTIANLLDSSFLKHDSYRKSLNENLLKDAYEMIQKHYPLDFVIRAMQDAVIKNNNDSEKYTENTLMDIAEFSEFRNLFVSKYPTTNIEFLDTKALDFVKDLWNYVHDEETIKTIVDATKIRKRYPQGIKVVDNELTNIAIKLLKNSNGKWTEIESKILEALKDTDASTGNQYIHEKKHEIVSKLIDLHSTPESILYIIE